MQTNATLPDITGLEHQVLCLIEDAALDVLPVGARWTISDPESDGFVLGDGPTVDAAVLAALPVALSQGYLDRADIDALIDAADDSPRVCHACNGCGESRSGAGWNCWCCGGSGVERREVAE